MASAIVGTGFFLFFQACGTVTAFRLFQRESGGVRLLLGSVLGSMMLQWLPVPFAFFLGFSKAAHLCAMALAAMIAAFAAFTRRGKASPGFRDCFSAFLCRKFLWVILCMALFFCFLVWHSFLYQNGRIYSSQATYGDMSMHLSFITSIARQGTFPPNYSLLPFARLSYPFLSDSISSSLYIWGVPLRWAYFLPMAFAGAQVFFGFYLFAQRLLSSGKKAAFAWMLFFFNGGFGFLYFLGDRESFQRIFTEFYQTPTNLVSENIRWVNVVVDMMLPQRATLFGWAVLFPTMYLLYRALYQGEKRYFLFAGAAAGLLPMIHTHSFFALALLCGVWLFCRLLKGVSRERAGLLAGKVIVLVWIPLFCLIQYLLGIFHGLESNGLLWAAVIAAGVFVVSMLWLLICNIRSGNGRELMGTWGVLFVTACALAVPQLLFWTFGQAGSGGFIRGHFGWSMEGENYLWFYLKNLGLAGILGLLGLLTVRSESFSKYSPVPVIWFLAEFVAFQPNTYDNNKLLYVAYALLCCCGAEFGGKLLEKLSKKWLRYGTAAAAVFLCSFSAVLTMGRESVAQYELFGDGAISLARYVEENTPADAVILTDTRHNNEICVLAGRNVVCGSPSYLAFHGLPFARNEWAVRQMYEKPEKYEGFFQEFEVAYVLISDFERSSYEVDEKALAARFEKVYDDGVRALFKTGF